MQILPDSPTEDGNDAFLSFFVTLPDGSTMPVVLLAIIYHESPNVILQPTALTSITNQNENLTSSQAENLIPLTVTNLSSIQVQIFSVFVYANTVK